MSLLEPEPLQADAVMAYMPLVRMVASSVFNQRSFDGVPFEEYLQFGVEGLIQAMRRYDAGLGAKFETYASHRIRGAIMSGLEKSTEINQQVATLRRMAQERIESLTPGPADDKPETGDAFQRLVEISLGLAVAFMLDDTALYHGCTPTHWDDGASNLAYKQLQQRLLLAVRDLPKGEQDVLEQHYFQHHSFALIAQSMSLTRSRVSQLHRHALAKLRAALAVGHFGELIG